jgi:hypothetical protein
MAGKKWLNHLRPYNLKTKEIEIDKMLLFIFAINLVNNKK